MIEWCFCGVVFVKRKTAVEMRISDESSDVFSSDLVERAGFESLHAPAQGCQPLDRGSRQIVQRLLLDKRLARRMTGDPQALRARVDRPEAFFHRARPVTAQSPELCNFLEEIDEIGRAHV